MWNVCLVGQCCVKCLLVFSSARAVLDVKFRVTELRGTFSSD